MSDTADRLRAIATEATALADSSSSPNRDYPLVTDVLATMIPAARIFVSEAQRGPWYAYVSMPPEFKPKAMSGHWLFNDSVSQPYYWFDKSGKTREEALKNAILSLIERTA